MSNRRVTRSRAHDLLSQQHNTTLHNIFASLETNQREASGSARTNGIEGETLDTGQTSRTRRGRDLRNRSASQPIGVGGAISSGGGHDNDAGDDSVIIEEVVYGPNAGGPASVATTINEAMEISSESSFEISFRDPDNDNDYYDDDDGDPASPDVHTHLRESSPAIEEAQLRLDAPQTPVFSEVQSSQSDFQSPSKKVCSSSRKRGSEEKKVLNDTVDEAELCTICFEQWTTSGRHRLVCLKCGHLYGQECIEKWLDTQKGTCPQCNAKASRKDIRCLYVRKLTAIDTTEMERMKKELEEERITRKKAEHDLSLMKLRWEQTEVLCASLRKDLATQRDLTSVTARQVVMDSSNQGGNTSGGRYDIEKTFAIDVGGCRVLAYNDAKSYLCASQASHSALYPGFGVRKLSTLDLKTYQYVPMHSKQIRDLNFHPTHETSLLLSCAMDKVVKVTSMESLETVQSFQCQNPVWSCTWSKDNLNHFFVGTQSGEVLLFDIRDTRDHVASLLPHNLKSVVSLRYIPRSTGDSPGPGGLLIGQLDRSIFLENNNNSSNTDNFSTHYLSNDSVLMSLSVEENTGHVLASYRPTQHAPTVRHEVSNLVLTPKPPMASLSSSFYERVAYEKVRTFNGGSSQQTLTRTTLLPHPGLGSEQLFVCAGDGNHPMVNLWNVSTGLLHQRLVGPDQGVSDICPITSKDGTTTLLSAVGNKHLFIYKWTELSQ